MILLLLLINSAYCADYTAAINASREAALIQSGAYEQRDKFQNYLEKRAIQIIDPPKIAFYGAFAYKIYRDQRLRFRLNQNTLVNIDSYPSVRLDINF